VGKTEVLPDKFSIKYESSIVFGRATELFETEKSIALLGFLKKYSPDFIAEGMKYIDASFDKVRVYKISIDSISGKSRK
jgi:nitroimidazol reductase NimA-like FMN-containing flavoprotein (pyridoxamine 5'-phosphate oxidase superfamily)